MSGEPTWGGPKSGAPVPGSLPTGAPADLPVDGDRLVEGGVLGVGGMGEVRAAFDPGLAREVAVKMPRSYSDAEDARLVAEARLTARLQHPGIIPVYHAGRRPDGRPYYAMRLLRGRSLADAFAALGPDDATGRLALVPRVLAVAQALAYAHEAGVVHRDVKPANILIGAFGETLLTDWGVAADPSAGAGTPQYMSPEQAAGNVVDGRTDVFALGVVLDELLAYPEAPAELRAIAARARRANPNERYRSMAELVGDLDAWFQGRRVAAYTYRPRDLLVRLVRLWRAPLLVAGVAAVLLATSVGVGWWRSTAERDRAVVAEMAASRAQSAAEAHLARALTAQALTAAAAGRRTEAELLAAQAVRLGPSPDARGVLAQFGGRARPRHLRTVPALTCRGLAASAHGELAACLIPDAVVVTASNAPEVVVARAEGPFVSVEPDLDGEGFLLGDADRRIWVWSPPEAPRGPFFLPGTFALFSGRTDAGSVALRNSGRVGEVRLADNRSWRSEACAGGDVRAFADAEAGVIVACSDGSIVRVTEAGATRMVTLAARGSPVGMVEQAGLLVVSTSLGELWVHRATEGWRLLGGVESDVRRIAIADGQVAVLADSGVLNVFHVATGARMLSVRVRGLDVAWIGDGVLRVYTSGAIEEFHLGTPPVPDVFRVAEGVSAVSNSRGWLAVGRGDGVVDVWRAADGQHVASVKVGAGAVKGLAWWEEHLAVAVATEASVQLLSPLTWEVVSRHPVDPLRRVDAVGGGLIGAAYAKGLRVVGIEPVLGLPDQLDVYQLKAFPDRRGAVIYASGGNVWWLEGTPLRASLRYPEVDADHVAAVGDDALLGVSGAILRVDPAGAVTQRWPLPARVSGLTTSHDGRLVAASLKGGTVLILRAADGEVLAGLYGHHGRVSSLEFSDDDAWLFTGAWDATARLWSMAELEADPGTVVARMEAAWGRGWEDVLRGDAERATLPR